MTWTAEGEGPRGTREGGREAVLKGGGETDAACEDFLGRGRSRRRQPRPRHALRRADLLVRGGLHSASGFFAAAVFMTE